MNASIIISRAAELLHSNFVNPAKQTLSQFGKISYIGVLVMPGLTRNPFSFQIVKLLDTGSDPA